MKFRIAFALCALLCALSVPSYGWNRLPIRSGPMNEIAPGQLLVKLKPTAANSRGQVVLPELPAGSYMRNWVGHMGWTMWIIPPKLDPRIAAKLAMRDPAVAYAEPANKIYLLLATPNDLDWGIWEDENSAPNYILNFGDDNPTFERLWHLTSDDAFLAWNDFPNMYYTTTNKPANAPIIAIVDSGIDPNHADFKGPGGFTTDVSGGGQINWGLSNHFNFGEADGGSWVDDNGHGTHVAGLALAAANNTGFDSHGVPGIGYNAQAMILRVIGSDSTTGTDADGAAAIFYAADHGADIINLSIGTTNYSQIFQDAVNYAWQKGSLVVAAGNEDGNGGANIGPNYPAACSGAIGVSATGDGYQPAYSTYSGAGSYIDISAPGGDVVQSDTYFMLQFVWSTACTYDCSLAEDPNVVPPYTLEYTYLLGTSMACPQVSGAAALYYGKYNLHQGQGHANMRAYRALERTAYGAMGMPNGAWESVQGYGCLEAADLLNDGNPRFATVGSIEGTVYEGGTPVQNVEVRAYKPNGQTYFSTSSLSDGSYRFDSMPPDTYTLKAAPFGHLKTRKALVMAGSDATNMNLWADGNAFDTNPPTIAIFNVTNVNSSSVSLAQWGYDVETGIDTVKIRIGTSAGAQDVYPETELLTENTNVTITGFTLQPNTNYVLRAIYTDGNGLSTTVDRTISFNTATVGGTITLQSYTGAMPTVTVQVRNVGSTTALQTYNVTPAANGSFTIPSPPAGHYDFAFKASHWLQKVVSNVNVTASGATGVSPSLFNGDINGDNAVTLGDFAQLRAAYGSTPGASNWNANADLNGDGAVTLGDFATLRQNYGRQGDQ